VRVAASQETSRHHSAQNWHSGTEVLFTMSRDRTEGGQQDGGRRTEGGQQDGGRRTEGGGRESGVRVRVRRGRNSARPPFALALHFRLSVAPPSQQGGGKTPIRSPPIYTGARMLKTRSQTCHFLPFFEFAAGRATRWRRSACQNGIKGSDLGCLCSGDRKKSGKYERRNGSASRRGCSLFLEGGQGGGRRTEDGEWMWLGRGSNG
jgi:hypothetical protein